MIGSDRGGRAVIGIDATKREGETFAPIVVRIP